MSNSIEFFCYENDNPIEIQLEPEAIIYVASPGNSLRFVAVNCKGDFKWSIRIDHSHKGIQLFPDTLKQYDIEIYKNNELLRNW
jgi:hypothetical protein